MVKLIGSICSYVWHVLHLPLLSCFGSGYSQADGETAAADTQRQDSWSGWSEDGWAGNSSDTQRPDLETKAPLTAKAKQNQQLKKSRTTGDEWDTWTSGSSKHVDSKVKDDDNELEKWLNDDTWDAQKPAASKSTSNTNKSAAKKKKDIPLFRIKAL